MNSVEMLKELKRLSWAVRQEYLKENPEGKFLSTYKIKEALCKPKDWNDIAEKCSKNPNHKFYGKDVEFILSQWQSKKSKGAKTGNSLDDYITAKFKGLNTKIMDFDDYTESKCRVFDNLKNDVFDKNNFDYIGSEIWLNSYDGLSVRMDALFSHGTIDKTLIIADWKNNQEISTENRWNKLIGPAAHLDDCDMVHMTIQVYIYEYILKEVYKFKNPIKSRIFQITDKTYHIPKMSFKYDAGFMKELIDFSKEKLFS